LDVFGERDFLRSVLSCQFARDREVLRDLAVLSKKLQRGESAAAGIDFIFAVVAFDDIEVLPQTMRQDRCGEFWNVLGPFSFADVPCAGNEFVERDIADRIVLDVHGTPHGLSS
jgi:hypothetical protein